MELNEETKQEAVPSEAEKLKAENDLLETELKRREELKAKSMYAGRSQAGTPDVKPESFEDKWRREAKERYKGTGMDPT